MPHYYLLRPDGSYSDSANYPEQPAGRVDGIWVEGKPENLESYKQVDLAGTLEGLFTSALAQFGEDVSAEDEAEFFILKTAVKEALVFNRVNAAIALIMKPQNLSPQLEAFRGQMLEALQNG